MRINIGFCMEPNFGDCFNLSVMPYLFGDDCHLYHWRGLPEGKIYLGLGTLVDYMIRLGWLRDRDVTLLGTGTNNFGTPAGKEFKGFARGELSAKRLGVKAVGDLGILMERVYGVSSGKDDRVLFTLGEKKTTEDMDDYLKGLAPVCPYDCNVAMSIGGAIGTYRDIATSKYIVTDKLHYAVAAEASRIPWVIYNHREGTLFEQPLRYYDWADMIGKSKFIIDDLSHVGIIEDNTNFDRSEQQKDELERSVKELIS